MRTFQYCNRLYLHCRDDCRTVRRVLCQYNEKTGNNPYCLRPVSFCCSRMPYAVVDEKRLAFHFWYPHAPHRFQPLPAAPIRTTEPPDRYFQPRHCFEHPGGYHRQCGNRHQYRFRQPGRTKTFPCSVARCRALHDRRIFLPALV